MKSFCCAKYCSCWTATSSDVAAFLTAKSASRVHHPAKLLPIQPLISLGTALQLHSCNPAGSGVAIQANKANSNCRKKSGPLGAKISSGGKVRTLISTPMAFISLLKRSAISWRSGLPVVVINSSVSVTPCFETRTPLSRIGYPAASSKALAFSGSNG